MMLLQTIYAIMCNVHTQYICKDSVVFRVKPVTIANINIINQPLIHSTSNVIVDLGKQTAIRENVLM